MKRFLVAAVVLLLAACATNENAQQPTQNPAIDEMDSEEVREVQTDTAIEDPVTEAAEERGVEDFDESDDDGSDDDGSDDDGSGDGEPEGDQ